MEEINYRQRLAFLIDLFQRGMITDQQYTELLDLLAMPEHLDQASLFLKQTWNASANAKFFPTDKSEALHQSLIEQLTIPKVKTFSLKRAGFRIIAAAAILVVIFSIVFTTQQDEGQTNRRVPINKPVPMLADVAPGSNKATLRLANNRLIVLDQVKPGVIEDIGNMQVTKNKNGQLVFEQHAVNKTEVNIGENILTTPAGGQYEVVLADGSHVWLNASTSLRFPSAFKGKQRSVTLVGEGYFEISKSKDQPFIVNAREMKVEVLGTHFNINAYPDELLATTLIEGSVKLSHRSNSVMLKPHEQANIKNGSFKVQKNIDVKDVLAWKEGYFVFNNEEIHSVMRKLSRWYNVKVEYEDPEVNEEFMGTISKFKNISEILKLLQATGTIKFKVLPSQDPSYERRVVVMK